MGVRLTIDQLRSMLGKTVNYHGVPHQVFEVLEDGPSLVLMDARHGHLQADQYQESYRRVPDTVTIPVLDVDPHYLNPDFTSLELLD